MSDLILYHGTSLRCWEQIQKDGYINPRAGEGNWALRSRDEYVYLTTVYAPFFAVNSSEGSLPVIIEVSVDTQLLYPDEDFLGQVLHQHYSDVPLDVLTETADVKLNQQFFDISLSMMGVAAHLGRIGKERWLRSVVVDNKSWEALAVDAQVSLLNHQFCSEKYRMLTQLAFGDIDEYIDPIVENLYKVDTELSGKIDLESYKLRLQKGQKDLVFFG